MGEGLSSQFDMTDPVNDPSAQAKRDLARLAADRDTLGTSALARMAEHLRADDASADDAIEKWGKRIGRGLGAVFFVFLAGSLALKVLGWY
jgi:predicted NBD/HSP70 family sugar kinase